MAIKLEETRQVKKVKTMEPRRKFEPVKSESDKKLFLSANRDIDQAKKLQKQKIVLVAILVIGIIVIGGAFWYRSGEKAKRSAELESQAVRQFTQIQTFDLQVPEAVDPAEYTPDRVRVRGRVLENTIELKGSYDEAVANSRRLAEKELQGEERLWSEPISPQQSEFPMTIRWLVYSDTDANALFLKKVESLNIENIEFALNNIEKTNVAATDNENIYNLAGAVTISLNEFIDVAEDTEKSEEIIEEVIVPEPTVVIKDTPTGWLNARAGPGTNYEIITKIYPGEEYELVEETDL